MTVTSKITVVPYMYRDASNYKSHHDMHLAGEITAEQREQVRQTLTSINVEHDGFIPEQIGWPHAGRMPSEWEFPGPSDHCWHELDVDEIYVTQVSIPPPEQTVRDWVNRMVNASTEGWDDAEYAIEPEED